MVIRLVNDSHSQIPVGTSGLYGADNAYCKTVPWLNGAHANSRGYSLEQTLRSASSKKTPAN